MAIKTQELLVIYPCDEQASHGDCWNVFNARKECVHAHVTYEVGYFAIYGCYPPDEDDEVTGGYHYSDAGDYDDADQASWD